ncbi:hypothetical protein [Actinomadura terrae]|uniref:hypothetical protein n=1 Tax=Actinomadura terrae TaxID=604353 RepID=UPI001FA71B5C|nr:hypothetical protein [Actinomadura terrae]
MDEHGYDLDGMADELARSGQVPDIMSNKCNGGGGSTTGQSPGCDDMSEATS